MPDKQGVLTREDIRELLKDRSPLIVGAVDLEEQLQPNGIDLTVRQIESFSSRGVLTETNDGRVLSQTAPVVFDESGGANLGPGAYLIMFNEVVNLPANIMALGRPRSSLNRCGVSIHSAIWDTGYSGRSQSMLVVYNVNGFRLHRNARVMQLVFFYTSRSVGKTYGGKFQLENI
jgi:dUTP pyrophosphatase